MNPSDVIETLLPYVSKEPTTTIYKSPYHFFAGVVIDFRVIDDPVILDFNSITVRGDLNSDIYFAGCISEATVDEIVPDGVSEPGIYRFALGVNIDGSSYWTDCGYEYDSWCNYDLMSQYKLLDKEIEAFSVGWCNIEDDFK